MEKASLYLNTISTTKLRKKKFLFRIQKHSQLKYFRKKYLNRDVKRDYREKHGITSRHASGVGKLEGLPLFFTIDDSIIIQFCFLRRTVPS